MTCQIRFPTITLRWIPFFTMFWLPHMFLFLIPDVWLLTLLPPPPAPLPSNHDFLIASFTPREISRVMQLLQSHEGLLLQTLQLALQAQDFKSIFSYLISEIKENTKSLFLPYYLPTDSMFTLYVSGNPPVTQLRTNQALKLEPLSHLSIQLGLQILNRSTHLELHSNNGNGDMYINSPYSTSVTSKHCFESLLLQLLKTAFSHSNRLNFV